jgi:hypothetical protein
VKEFIHSEQKESMLESKKIKLIVTYNIFINFTCIVRVGGGYLSIDEFIDQYTPAELERLERKDPLKKFSEKVALQKTLLGREVRESSPIRGGNGESPVSSPSRQNRGSPIRQNSGKSPKKQ